MFPAGTLEAFGLYLVRTSALVLAAPLLGTGSTFSGYKIGLIGSLSLLLYTARGGPLGVPIEALSYSAMALREIVIGLFLAFTLHAVILAVRVAGDMIGNEMGFGMAAAVDPATGTRVAVVSQMYEILFLLALLGVNGHHWLLRALSESFVRAPIGHIEIQTGIASSATALVGELFAAGIAFATPVLVLLALVSLVVGLLARTVPQLNVLEFGFNLRIGAALLGMLAFTPVLAPNMDRLLDHLVDGIDASLDVVSQ
jgi:flagellar biosynthetic protein FliR